MAVVSVRSGVSSSLYCLGYSPFATSPVISRGVLVCKGCLVSRRMSSSHASSSLIVGLGNLHIPETRHSVGMRVVDGLAGHLGAQWKYSRRCLGYLAVCEDNNSKVVLLKPWVAMNLNGQSIARTVKMFQPDLSSIYLVHDDLDKCLGKYSIKTKGSAGGHRGVKSAVGLLKTDAIKRLRIGIGRPEDRTDVVDYVLRDFDPKELPLVEEVVERCTGLLLGQLQEVPSTEVVAIPGLSVSLTHQ